MAWCEVLQGQTHGTWLLVSEQGLRAHELVAEGLGGLGGAGGLSPSSLSLPLSLPVSLPIPAPRSSQGGERQPQAGPELFAKERTWVPCMGGPKGLRVGCAASEGGAAFCSPSCGPRCGNSPHCATGHTARTRLPEAVGLVVAASGKWGHVGAHQGTPMDRSAQRSPCCRAPAPPISLRALHFYPAWQEPKRNVVSLPCGGVFPAPFPGSHPVPCPVPLPLCRRDHRAVR